MGFRSKVARTTLADANERRDWRIYADFAQVLIGMARPLYAEDPIGVELDQGLYSTTRPVSFTIPMGPVRRHKAAVKMHTLRSSRQHSRVYPRHNGKVHDANVLDEIAPEAGAFYVMDRARNGSFSSPSVPLSLWCVLRRTSSCGGGSRRVDTTTGLRSETVILTTNKSAKTYPDPLRRISYFDADAAVEVPDQPSRSALTITQIYKSRWQVELFFKWIKQHLRIKSFYGTSENAVKTQIWIAISVYVHVAIIRKRLGIDRSLYQILQILRRFLRNSPRPTRLIPNSMNSKILTIWFYSTSNRTLVTIVVFASEYLSSSARCTCWSE